MPATALVALARLYAAAGGPSIGETLITVLLALLAAAVTWAGFRLSGKSAKAQADAAAKAVDASAYDRASGIYERAIAQLQGEMDSLRSQNQRLSEANSTLRDQIGSLREQVTNLRQEVAHLHAYRAEIDNLVQDNRVLAAKVVELGGDLPPRRRATDVGE